MVLATPAGCEAGAVYVNRIRNIQLTDSTFENNTVTDAVGGTTNPSSLCFSDLSYTSGGAFYAAQYRTVNITNSSFTDNVSGGAGGALMFYNGADTFINGSNFMGNIGSSQAGGAALFFIVGNVSITNSNFVNNQGKLAVPNM